MLLLRLPYLNIAVVSLITVFMTAGILRLEIDASISTMLVTGDPAYQAHDEYKTWFGSDEVVSVAIPFEESLAVDALILQRAILHDLESIEGVVEVRALVSQEDVVGDGDSLDVLPLIPEDIPKFLQRRGARDRLRNRVVNHPIWTGWLVSKDTGAIAMQVRLEDSPAAQLRREQTMDEIDVVLSSALNGGEYFLAGHPFMKSEIARSIASDLARLLPIVFLAMSVLLFIVTRSLYVGGATAFSVLLSVVWMVGSMGWLGLGMTALTNAAPTILLALSTACFLHFTAAYQSASAPDNSRAAEIGLSVVLRPTWVASITTALGYASLSMSSVPIVREFGLTLAVGSIGTATIATFFLPAVLSLSPSYRSESGFVGGYGFSGILFRIGGLTSRYARQIVLAGVVLGSFMVISAMQIEVDTSGPRRFGEDSRFSVASRFYRSEMSGDVLESVYLKGEPGVFLNPDVLRRLQRFKVAAVELAAVDKVISIADHIARTYWVFRGEVGDPSALPESSNAVAQLLLLYESSGELGDISDLVTPDRSMIRIMLTADVQSSAESRQLRSDLNAIIERLLPDLVSEYSVVSTEMLLSQAADVIAVEQVRSAILALLLVLVVISISFGSIGIGGLVVLPNVLPIVTNLGLMALFGIALSNATSIISATAIGIAVDSTVHLLNAIREAEKHLSSRRAAVLHALTTTGKPVVVSSLVVVMGFLFLLFSEFGSVAELGFLTALTMLYCLVADLFVLPAQLLMSNRVRAEPDPYILTIDGRAEIGRAIQMESGDWQFATCRDGSFKFIDPGNVSDIRRIGIDGRVYVPADLELPRVQSAESRQVATT